MSRPVPGHKRPAVEDLPDVRPRCQRCGKVLPFWTNETREDRYVIGDDGDRYRRSVVVRRVFTQWRGYPTGAEVPIFCTLRCALWFAMAAHRAGYRITRGA